MVDYVLGLKSYKLVLHELIPVCGLLHLPRRSCIIGRFLSCPLVTYYHSLSHCSKRVSQLTTALNRNQLVSSRCTYHSDSRDCQCIIYISPITNCFTILSSDKDIKQPIEQFLSNILFLSTLSPVRSLDQQADNYSRVTLNKLYVMLEDLLESSCIMSNSHYWS